MRVGPCHSVSTVPPRSGTVPGTDTVSGTDGTLDVQVPSERVTGVVPKNRLEVFFQNLHVWPLPLVVLAQEVWAYEFRQSTPGDSDAHLVKKRRTCWFLSLADQWDHCCLVLTQRF